MRVFVKEATGFIGERLVECLTRRGDVVHALCRTGCEGKSACENVHVFRGDLLDRRSVERAMSDCDRDWMAICVQMVPQCLWHIGLPPGETFSSIASGILFGVITLRTGSIVWAWILRYAIGVSLDILIFNQQ